jgi:hypothetical protein
MEPVHLRLAEIGLHVAGRYGFALAGGYAVQAHGILYRPSEDIDLFTAWDRRGDFTAAVDAVTDAYTQHGYTVEVTQRFETFARLAVRGLVAVIPSLSTRPMWAQPPPALAASRRP